MKIIISMILGIVSVSSSATTKSFDVKAEVSIGGKLISTPHIVTKPNELASISQTTNNKETVIEVVASDFSSKEFKDAIKMNFTVSSVEGGKRTVLSKPQIVALPGEEALINVGNKDTESVNIKVVATRNQ